MAAGFTFKTSKLKELQKFLEELAEKQITQKLLTRNLRIDCNLPLEFISDGLFESINEFSPFGYGNPEPVFLAKKVTIENMQLVGVEKKHLKLYCSSGGSRYGAIMFGYDNSLSLSIGDKVDIVYSISQNEWNGNKKLELKIKDIEKD